MANQRTEFIRENYGNIAGLIWKIGDLSFVLFLLGVAAFIINAILNFTGDGFSGAIQGFILLVIAASLISHLLSFAIIFFAFPKLRELIKIRFSLDSKGQMKRYFLGQFDKSAWDKFKP